MAVSVNGGPLEEIADSSGTDFSSDERVSVRGENLQSTKDTISSRVKLATEIEESTSSTIDYGTVSHPMTL